MLKNLPYLGLYFLFPLFFACDSPAPVQNAQPNILWIIAEDLSQDLGCYGNDLVNTPILDSLAGQGIKFTNVFTTSPVCAPSRTALATGIYQTSLGAYHMRYPDSLKPALPANIQTIPQLLQENNYVTANIKDGPGKGKLDWLFHFEENEHFDYQHWSELKNQSQPFFAQVSVSHTHRAFPEYDPEAFPLEQIKIPPYYPDHKTTRKDFAGYYQSIEALDQDVKMILDSLRHHELAENTIIFFFSDHGRPMTRAKMFLYDSGLEVPCIISFPKGSELFADYQKGTEDTRLLSAIDLSATTLALAGIPPPDYVQGKNLLPLEAETRSSIFASTNRIGESNLKSRAVRTKDFKYIRNYNRELSVIEAATAYRQAMHPIHQLMVIQEQKNALTEAQKQLFMEPPAEELYNLEQDPYEINNLATEPDYQSQLQKMRNLLDEKLATINDKGLNEDPQEIVDAFDAYGVQSAERYLERENVLYKSVLEDVEENENL